MKRSKSWLEAHKKRTAGEAYHPEKASALIKDLSCTRFDASIDASIKIAYKSLQNVRGLLRLPHGTGKQVRVLVFAKEDRQAEAKEAGADFVGGLDIVEKIKKEKWTDFDACVSTLDMMKDVGKLGPILGRKGLMPKPKAGTVTNDIALAIKNLKAGQMEYRCDKAGVIHASIGKISYESAQILENISALYQSIIRDKPSDAKGVYVHSFFISPTMGPSLRLDHKFLV